MLSHVRIPLMKCAVCKLAQAACSLRTNGQAALQPDPDPGRPGYPGGAAAHARAPVPELLSGRELGGCVGVTLDAQRAQQLQASRGGQAGGSTGSAVAQPCQRTPIPHRQALGKPLHGPHLQGPHCRRAPDDHPTTAANGRVLQMLHAGVQQWPRTSCTFSAAVSTAPASTFFFCHTIGTMISCSRGAEGGRDGVRQAILHACRARC